MTNDQILERLNEIFSSVLGKPGLKLSLDTQQGELEDWDSINHINIVVSVEKEFKIKFKLSEVQKLVNVQKFISLIQEKQA